MLVSVFKYAYIDLENSQDEDIRAEIVAVDDEIAGVRQIIMAYKGCKRCKEYKDLVVEAEKLRVYRRRLVAILDDIPF